MKGRSSIAISVASIYMRITVVVVLVVHAQSVVYKCARGYYYSRSIEREGARLMCFACHSLVPAPPSRI